MRKFFMLTAIFAVLAMAGQAGAVQVSLHGDLRNEFNLYTNQAVMYSGGETLAKSPVRHDTNNAFFGKVKYRLWTGLASNDGKVKLVYGIELGGLDFGNKAYSKGGAAATPATASTSRPAGPTLNSSSPWCRKRLWLPLACSPSRSTTTSGRRPPWAYSSPATTGPRLQAGLGSRPGALSHRHQQERLPGRRRLPGARRHEAGGRAQDRRLRPLPA